jgi:HD-GYP domain-containing protein (c-di-GMP phosphodiesterase class II)/sensor domain CHASE-containing protein/HAMP domain-containing protein
MIRGLRWNVRTHFLLAFLFATIVPLVAFAGVTYVRTVSSLHQVERDQMNTQAAGVQALLLNRRADEKSLLMDYAVWTALVRQMHAIDSPDATIHAKAATWMADNISAWITDTTPTNLALIYDNAGTVVAGRAKGVATAKPSAEIARSDVYRRAASGHDAAGLISFDGMVYVIAAGPIVPNDRDLAKKAGVLVFAQAISGSVLDDINRVTGGKGKLVMYTYGRATAATDPTEAGQFATFSPGDRRPGDVFAEGSFMSQLVEIANENGQVIGLLKVSVPRGPFNVALSDLHGLIVLSLIVALFLAAGAGLLMSRTVSRPLQKLAGAAAAMAGGAVRQRLDFRRRDEIGKLAAAFNTMSDRVATHIEELSSKTQNLSAEIANLNEFGTKLAQTTDVHAELRRLADMIREIFTGGFAAVYLRHEGDLELAAFSGSSGSPVPAAAVHELAAWVVAAGEATQATNLSLDPRISDAARLSSQAATSGALIVPMTRQDGVVGALAVGSTHEAVFATDDLALLSTVAAQIAVALQNAEAYSKLNKMYLETVTALAAAMEAKDQYTAEHADSLALMAVAVGVKLQLGEQELRHLQFAAVLHDIGKIGIPGAILNKPDKLTKDEFGVMAEHTIIGERIISRIDYLVPISRVIRSAHERWDGKGYPDGIAGDAIPMSARILFVCDAFHAMTSDRPYRKALPVEDALNELRTHAGSQFDPAVVEAFLEAYPFEDVAPVGQFSRFALETVASLN